MFGGMRVTMQTLLICITTGILSSAATRPPIDQRMYDNCILGCPVPRTTGSGDPVCGSNNKVYANEEALFCEKKCLEEQIPKVVSTGRCGEPLYEYPPGYPLSKRGTSYSHSTPENYPGKAEDIEAGILVHRKPNHPRITLRQWD